MQTVSDMSSSEQISSFVDSRWSGVADDEDEPTILFILLKIGLLVFIFFNIHH